MHAPRRKTIIEIIILLLILAVTFSLAMSLLLPKMLDLNNYQAQLTTLLQQQLHRQVRLGNSRFSWMFGPEFSFSDLYIQERDSKHEFLSAGQVSFRLALLPLLNKQIKLREIIVDNARIVVSRDETGKLNIADLLQPAEGGYELQARGLKIRNSTLFWRDQSTSPTCTNLTVSGINLSLNRLVRGKKSSFKLSAILEGSTANTLVTSGSVKIPKAGEPLTQAELDLRLELKQLEYWRLWPYLQAKVPFPSPNGTLSTSLALQGHWQDIKAKGSVLVNDATVVWPAVFHGPVSSSQIKLGLDAHWQSDRLELSTLQLGVDGFSLTGSLSLSRLNGKDPFISAKATTEPFDYSRVRSYIPFGIIADDTADFIEHKIQGGTFKLTNGTLNGSFSQLAHFGVGNNANALYILGSADEAVVQYGEKSPTFRHIKGTLEMKGRDFNLIGMSGTFGGAPFTMAGSIKEYATEGVPTLYPFTMTIAPQPAEVAWLAAIAGAEALRFHGSSTTLKLQGDGPTTAYRISGEWLLQSAAYEYPSVVKKPAGMPNTLTFSTLIDKYATKFTSVSYQLPPFRVSGDGELRYSGQTPHLSFDLESNHFPFSRQLPLLPQWQEYQLHGGVQAHILGNGDPRSLASMQFSGSIGLNDFSLRPWPHWPPVNAISTQIAFKGNTLETSSMAIRYGSTPLLLKGRVVSLENPEAELFVSSPDLNPADFGIAVHDKPPRIKQFSTQLALRDKLLTIRNVSGKLPKTSLSAAGTINLAHTPDINLRIAATYLDLEELVPLLAPTRPAGSGVQQADTSPAPRFKATIVAESGSYHSIAFNKLSASVKNDAGILKLDGLQAQVFGGSLSLNGQLSRIEQQAPLWDLSFQLERAKALELLQALEIGREVRGATTVQAKLSARGDSLADLKKSARGTINLKVDRGVLRRFNSLAKVVSILNVSQLLRFSLPDMARDGMPFNKITASIAVKDGVLTTRDFFIDSNVMHVTTVGSIDIVHETINTLIGVQPLQTVDTIVSRIPVVGWILSGGDGSLITTYFEAKGTWKDPQVSAIPVSSMAKGTLDIFRRIFELPVRLFTDSGEVLLGNQKERPKATPPP